jgi:hypothetical protein
MNAQQEIQSLRAEIQKIEKDLTPKRSRLNELLVQEHEATAAKVKRCEMGQDKFDLAELVYAADNRCLCGAGMAYPTTIGPWGSWICSAILLGQAQHGTTHTRPMPFSMYEVKSENQPSANDATTRPT